MLKDEQLVRLSTQYVRESEEAKRDRMDRNKVNFDVFHLRQDYSHKQPGMSREFLAKQPMAVEQIVSFFQQGLTDTSDWFTITVPYGAKKNSHFLNANR
jgi:hypothetical protein